MLSQNLQLYVFLFRFEFAKPPLLIHINLFVIEILDLVGSCDVLLKEIKAYDNYAYYIIIIIIILYYYYMLKLPTAIPLHAICETLNVNTY